MMWKTLRIIIKEDIENYDVEDVVNDMEDVMNNTEDVKNNEMEKK